MPDIELDVGLQLIASIETLTTALAREEEKKQRMMRVVRQIPLIAPQAVLTAGNGVIDYPDLLAAKTGYCWSVRRLVLTGWSAGSVIVYRNGGAIPGGGVLPGEPVLPAPVPAASFFGRGELLLNPGDRLVLSATGITGYVQLNGIADCFESWYLPEYLG